MTLSQLNTAVNETEQEIERLRNLASSRNYTANSNVALASKQAAWLSSKSNRWRKKNSSEVGRVISDNVRLKSQANNYRAEAKKILEVTIPGLQKTLADQNQAIVDFNKTELEVSRELSKQGETRDSVKTKADFEGRANYDASMLAAQSEASEKKNLNYLYIAAGLVVIAIVAFVAYKKISK